MIRVIRVQKLRNGFIESRGFTRGRETDTAIANDAAVLKFEVADVCKLLLLGMSDECKQE